MRIHSTERRLALLAGLVLLALIVLATGIQAAQAATVTGTGAGSGAASFTSTTQLQGLTAARAAQHDQGTVLAVTAGTAPAGTQGRGGVASAAFAPASGAQPAASGTSAAWIIAGSVAAVLLVGFAAWAVLRRRRQPGERPSAAYCAQHGEDALCTAA